MKQDEQRGDRAHSDAQVISPPELAEIVKILRGSRNWSQEQLADISGLTVRTVQRLERGEGSHFDTRRALARAFEASDIDCFNKPFVRITPEYAKSLSEQIAKDYLVLQPEVGTGAVLVELAEVAGLDLFHSAAAMSRSAEETFAALTDYWRDYRDTRDCYDAVGKLDVRDALQQYLDELDRFGISVLIAHRPIAVGPRENGATPYRTRVAYVAAFAKGSEPKDLIVERTSTL